MSDPTIVTRLSHREGLFVRNSNLSSGSATDIWADRVQSVDPVLTHNTTDYFEIGRTSKIGITQDPTTYRISFQENLHNSKIDMFLAGVNPTTGSGYYVSNIVTQTNKAYVVRRNDNDSVDEEIAIDGCRVTEITYTFNMGGACTTDYVLMGTSGSYYHATGSYVHPLWGAPDNTSAGAIHGKDARIAFGSNLAANKVYRLQRFLIRVTFPEQTTRELGRRALVGTMVDTPNITVEWDLEPADFQPHDVFYPVSNDTGVPKRVLGQPGSSDIFINVYDPDAGEASTVVKSFAIANCRLTSESPTTIRVRNKTTARWAATFTSEKTIGSGGLKVSKTELTTA